MTIYQWLCVLGIPGLFLSLITFIRLQVSQNRAMKFALQAILRDRLFQMYKNHLDKGYADSDDRLNFENLYLQYHTLGSNGVMDDIRKKFLDLPIYKRRET